MKPVLAMAGFVLLEARRTRLAWLFAVVALLMLGAGLFAGTVAIAESAIVRASIAAAGLRLVCVFLLALFVIASMVRAIDDKQLDLLVAMPLSRVQILAGRALGYAGIAVLLALAAGTAMTALAGGGALLAWTLSLALELLVVAAVALLCVLTFTQVTAAMAAVAAFYVLARSIDALLLMATSPLAQGAGPADDVIAGVLGGIAFLLPPLGRYTAAGWLGYGAPEPAALAMLAVQCAAFVLLVLAAAAFDLHRRSF